MNAPTTQQQAFIDAVARCDGNKALQARAGTGKTTTILSAVDALRAAHPERSVTVCAYNKAIADEVAGKLKRRGHDDWKTVGAQTAHAMGWGLVRFAFRSPKIDSNKVRDIVRTIVDGQDADGRPSPFGDAIPVYVLRQYGAQVMQLVSLGKQAGVGFFDDLPIGSVQVWADLADHYDVNGLDETDAMEQVISAAQVLYKISLQMTGIVDFDDMILFPLIKNIRVKFTRDEIFVDEAQDISRARFALVRKFVAPGGNLHIIGDDRQAIYGFSGADTNAMANMVEALGAEVFPLTVTFRCPKQVVALAQQIVPDYEAAPEAPEGLVERVEDLPTDLAAGDAILCRNTAPLISTAYALIRKGVACKVEGRSIGIGLAKLARRWKLDLVEDLLVKLEDYEARETQKALAKGSEQKAQEVADKVATLREICTAVQMQGKQTVEDVVAFIENLFGDDVGTNVVVLATYHRSKGREWQRVILLEHAARCPSKAARLPWQQLQERNLAYVAITRSMSTLVFVR